MNNLAELSTKIHLEKKRKTPKEVESKMTTIRPCNSVAVLIEILAYLDDKKNGGELIYEVFGDALARFVVKSKQHIPALEKILTKLQKEGTLEKHFNDESAIAYLNKRQVISIDNPYISKDPLFTEENMNKVQNLKS